MPKRIFYSILILSFIICACAKPKPKYSMNVSTGLADKGSLQIALDIEFQNKEDLKIFKKNSGKIKYALRMMFSGYPSNELVNKGITNNTVQKLFTSRFNLEFHKVTITNFVVKDAKGEKVTKKTVFATK